MRNLGFWLGAELESSFEKILNSLGEVPFFFLLVKPQVPFGSKTVVDWFTSSEWGAEYRWFVCCCVGSLDDVADITKVLGNS